MLKYYILINILQFMTYKCILNMLGNIADPCWGVIETDLIDLMKFISINLFALVINVSYRRCACMFLKQNTIVWLSPWQKAPKSAPITRPRLRRDATQDASMSVNFKGTSAADDVNCAKYGEAQPLARPETMVSRLTVKRNASS